MPPNTPSPRTTDEPRPSGRDIEPMVGRVRRRRRAASVLPTLLTLGNAICGFAAIHYAAKPIADTAFGWSTLTVAGVLVFLGMFFDAIDGSVARLTRSTSDIGAQLDSLADVITFGVAPAFMTLRLISHYYGPAGDLTILGPADSAYAKILWAIAAFYMCCTALRLARFNAEVRSAKEEDHLYFKGLPSPGAGGTVASLIVLHQHLLHETPGIEEGLAFARAAALEDLGHGSSPLRRSGSLRWHDPMLRGGVHGVRARCKAASERAAAVHRSIVAGRPPKRTA